MDAEHDTSEAAAPCCDGTGWTGDDWRRCVEHYDPPVWPMVGYHEDDEE